MIEFTQVNLHKASQATMLAGQSMVGKEKIVLAITEPHTVAAKITGMPKGTKSVYDRTTTHTGPPPRAAIIANAAVEMNALDRWCSRDCAAALLKTQDQQILILSVYLDIKLPVVQP